MKTFDIQIQLIALNHQLSKLKIQYIKNLIPYTEYEYKSSTITYQIDCLNLLIS